MAINTSLTIPLDIPFDPPAGDFLYRAKPRARGTSVPPWWPFDGAAAPNTGISDIEEKWWLEFAHSLDHEFNCKLKLAREVRSMPFGFRWLNTAPWMGKNVVDALLRGNKGEWIIATAEWSGLKAFSYPAVGPFIAEAGGRDTAAYQVQREAFDAERVRLKQARYLAAAALRPWEHRDFIDTRIPLYLLKALGLPATSGPPRGPFVYATVFLADVGTYDRPWLYIGKRMHSGDDKYLGSGKILQMYVAEFGESMFRRYIVASLPKGALPADLEVAERAVLLRFQASSDKRLFNLVNS